MHCYIHLGANLTSLLENTLNMDMGLPEAVIYPYLLSIDLVLVVPLAIPSIDILLQGQWKW